MTTNPYIVHSYEECSDINPFASLKLNCAVPTAEGDADASKLMAVVMYKPRYFLPCGEPALLKFSLGRDVKVNAIIGMPQIKAWHLVLDLNAKQCFSKVFNMRLPFKFSDAASGLPSNVNFTSSDFGRPCPDKACQTVVQGLHPLNTSVNDLPR